MDNQPTCDRCRLFHENQRDTETKICKVRLNFQEIACLKNLCNKCIDKLRLDGFEVIERPW